MAELEHHASFIRVSTPCHGKGNVGLSLPQEPPPDFHGAGLEYDDWVEKCLVICQFESMVKTPSVIESRITSRSLLCPLVCITYLYHIRTISTRPNIHEATRLCRGCKRAILRLPDCHDFQEYTASSMNHNSSRNCYCGSETIAPGNSREIFQNFRR